MNRISSGVPGFDELVGGGIPERDVILLSGTAGSGKTTLGLQFASADNGVFLTFEDEIEQLHEMSDSMQMNSRHLVDSGKLRILKYDPFRLEDILEIVENSIREIGARRVVVDSASALGIYMHDPAELRRMILQINAVLRRNACTGLLISEIPPNKAALSRFGMEEFVADGVVIMRNYLREGVYRRGITVWKMRLTDHDKCVHEYAITGRGVVVSKNVIGADVF